MKIYWVDLKQAIETGGGPRTTEIYEGATLTQIVCLSDFAAKEAECERLRNALKPFAEIKPPDVYFEAEYITCAGKGWSGGTHVPWSAVIIAQAALEPPKEPKDA